MSLSRCLGALALTVALAACGGSRRAAQTKPSHGTPAPTVPSGTSALILPASTAGATSCTVYGPGYGTQVIFDSDTLNVSAECQDWTSRQPGAGYLWAYQPNDTAIDATAVPVCDLRDPSGRVRAIVVEDTGCAPLSAAERQTVSRACSNLAASGWARANRGA